ncbi:hypothetical protein ACFFJK_04635 [Massilia consociata]|uniref:Uncharacterized protein n=2 Tax=Massilia consociata TaxID=760117 RepID=A0ABV6FCC2_9BURK
MLTLFVVAAVLPSIVSAQVRERPRKECFRTCLSVDPTPHKGRYEEKLAAIRESKKRETDVRKLEQLNEAEQHLTEKHLDSVDNMCHKICDQNPEE